MSIRSWIRDVAISAGILAITVEVCVILVVRCESWDWDRAANIATAVSLPLGVGVLGLTVYQYQKERARNAFAMANDRYLEFLRLCLDNWKAEAFESNAASENDHRRNVIFAVLITAMEAAFVQYHSADRTVRGKQWAGWAKYIDAWLEDPRFREAVADGDQYDEDFGAYVRERQAVVTVATAAPGPPDAPAAPANG